MTITVDRYLNFQLAQAALNGFIQADILTNILPKDGEALEIVQIELELTAGIAGNIGADAYVNWSITRDTKTALASLNDDDCIYKDGFSADFTTSGMAVVQNRWVWTPPEGLVIVEPTIYAQLSSAGLVSMLLTMDGRIHYRTVKVSEVEILRILNNQ